MQTNQADAHRLAAMALQGGAATAEDREFAGRFINVDAALNGSPKVLVSATLRDGDKVYLYEVIEVEDRYSVFCDGEATRTYQNAGDAVRWVLTLTGWSYMFTSPYFD